MTVDPPHDDAAGAAPEGSPGLAAYPPPDYGLPPGYAAPPPGYGWPPGYGAPGYAAPPPGYGWPPGYGAPGYAAPPPGYGWPPGYAPQPAYPTNPAYGWPPANGWPPAPPPVYPAPGYSTAPPYGWAYPPNPWAYPNPYIPWGYGPPPAAEAPGRLHPAVPPRRIDSLRERARPRMYAAGWLLTLVGLFTVIAIITAGYAGLSRGAPGLAVASVFELGLVLLSIGLVAAALAQGSQRKADGWQDYFGPSPFLVVPAWLSASLAAELVLFGVIDSVGISLATSVETLLGLLVNVAGYLVLVQLVVVRPGALSWRDMARPLHLARHPSDVPFLYGWAGAPTQTAGQRRGTLVGDIGLALALAIPILIGTLILTGILVTILGLQGVDLSGPSPRLLPNWDLWITLLAAAVVAPIGEEIFFRGFATNAWARSLTRNSAIIRAAVFFAFIHIINLVGAVSPDIFLRAAILAVGARIPVAWMLTWIYTRRRSIYASITLHAAYNGSLVLLAWWITRYFAY